MSNGKQFKKGQEVTFTAGKESGAGKVVGFRETLKGVFYEVKDKATGRVRALRGAALVAA